MVVWRRLSIYSPKLVCCIWVDSFNGTLIEVCTISFSFSFIFSFELQLVLVQAIDDAPFCEIMQRFWCKTLRKEIEQVMMKILVPFFSKKSVHLIPILEAALIF